MVRRLVGHFASPRTCQSPSMARAERLRPALSGPVAGQTLSFEATRMVMSLSWIASPRLPSIQSSDATTTPGPRDQPLTFPLTVLPRSWAVHASALIGPLASELRARQGIPRSAASIYANCIAFSELGAGDGFGKWSLLGSDFCICSGRREMGAGDCFGTRTALRFPRRSDWVACAT